MERRKFLANLVCLGVGAAITPQAVNAIKTFEKLNKPLSDDKKSYKANSNITIGCISEMNNNEISIIPVDATEELPPLKKGDCLILLSSVCPESIIKPSPHHEENSTHQIIIAGEDVPNAGVGNKITFLLDKKSKSRIWDLVAFPPNN